MIKFKKIDMKVSRQHDFDSKQRYKTNGSCKKPPTSSIEFSKIKLVPKYLDLQK